MKYLRILVYAIIFLALPTAGFGISLHNLGANPWLVIPAMAGFFWVQKEMLERAFMYEYLTKFMKVTKRKSLYLITLKEEQ